MRTVRNRRAAAGRSGKTWQLGSRGDAFGKVTLALLPLFCILVAVCTSAVSASAADIVEAWRGGSFVSPFAVSVNPNDDSCWVVDYDGDVVAHLAEDGTELWRGTAFNGPADVSVNTSDNSCWATVARRRVPLAVVSLCGCDRWLIMVTRTATTIRPGR